MWRTSTGTGPARSGAPATAGAPGAALRCDGLTWRIGGVPILEQVSLTAAPGEFIGVIGPNGAGKTSLFNAVSGLYRPSAGRILLHRHDITGLPVHRRTRLGLGRTFQSSAVFTTMSVVDHVRLARRARRTGLDLWRGARQDPRVNDEADRYLADVGLARYADRPAGQLSHGDRRKLEIALLLAGEPTVVLLDEPFAGVAAPDIPDLITVIRGLTRDNPDRTVLMVEHHMEAVLHLADRIAVLHHGSLLAFDTPEAVMADRTVQEAYLGEQA